MKIIDYVGTAPSSAHRIKYVYAHTCSVKHPRSAGRVFAKFEDMHSSVIGEIGAGSESLGGEASIGETLSASTEDLLQHTMGKQRRTIDVGQADVKHENTKHLENVHVCQEDEEEIQEEDLNSSDIDIYQFEGLLDDI